MKEKHAPKKIVEVNIVEVNIVEDFTLEYQPGVRLGGALDRDGIAEAFRDGLREARDREMRMGSTMVGPQRDDLLLTVVEGLAHRELREFGSGGQRRTAALALRLVEAATIREAR